MMSKGKMRQILFDIKRGQGAKEAEGLKRLRGGRGQERPRGRRGQGMGEAEEAEG